MEIWMNTANSSVLFGLFTFAYFGAAVCYLGLLVFKKKVMGAAGFWITLVTVIAHTGAIVWRWVESYQMGIGHAPFVNMFETLVFFAWVIAVIYLVIEIYYKTRAIGAYVMPLPFLAMAYAGFQPKNIEPLVPALKSNWLIAHVITCFLGYSGFALAAGLGLMYLTRSKNNNEATENSGFRGLLPSHSVMSSLIYQNIVFGFLLLTVGIITGSIWAHAAWGSYWSWDPKETWSLITWLIYAAILHLYMVKGWAGTRIAIMSLVGFACVLFTYFGVNLFLAGLHSYA
jgi:cytochrome c-type biogenesis protein CcsB